MKGFVKKFAIAGLFTLALSNLVSANEIKRPASLSNRVAVFTTISCAEARNTLEAQGFGELLARDCAGIQYKFEGKRRNTYHVIVFSSESGGWVSLPR